MKSRLAVVVFLLLATVLAFGTPESVSSQAGQEIQLSSTVQAAFPTLLTFKVQAQGPSDITRLRLHYRVERRNFAEVISEAWPQFNPGKVVDASWSWDMRRGGLPPGAEIEYWWTAEDAAGGRGATAPAVTVFNDSARNWKSMKTGVVSLYWYRGSDGFARELMDAAQQGLARLQRDTGASPTGGVDIFIYGTFEDLRGALVFPQEWTGGVSFSEFDVIAIGVPESEIEFGKRAMVHELSHWIIGQIHFNNYGADVPVWLEEGLATYGEGEVTAQARASLELGIRQDRLFSVRSLSSPFSAFPDEAFLSYAQSRSIVAHLIQKYGADKMLQLLKVFAEGSRHDDALRKVYGFDQDGLDAEWRATLNATSIRGAGQGSEVASAPAFATMAGAR